MEVKDLLSLAICDVEPESTTQLFRKVVVNKDLVHTKM